MTFEEFDELMDNDEVFEAIVDDLEEAGDSIVYDWRVSWSKLVQAWCDLGEEGWVVE